MERDGRPRSRDSLEALTYRDENEALRARVERLEEENRELKDKLAPPPPAPPPPAPAPSPSTRTSAPPRPFAALARRILVGAIVLSLLFTCTYFACAPVRAAVWRGRSTFECPLNGDVTIRGKTIRVPDGPAVKVEINCTLRLVHCDIRGPRGLELSVNNNVRIEDSRIEATDVALALGTNSFVDATGSTIVGTITPLDAPVLGVTAEPIDRVAKDRHAVPPLDYAARAREMARLGPTAALRSIDILYADARGLVDLDAGDYHGLITYEYEVPVNEPAVPPPPPVRPGLVPPPQPVQMLRIAKRVRLDATEMRVVLGSPDQTPPLEAVTAPRCTMSQIWAAVRSAGVPQDAVAHVHYDAGGAGRWSFKVDHTPFAFEIDNVTCAAVATDEQGPR
jgi:hypothetical protein